jgi:endonuclease YncB( thermonuclease family)
MLRFIVPLLLVVSTPVWAAESVASDADTLKVGEVTYRLDGIDAPEADQMCLDKQGATWPCGLDARNRLRAHLGSRTVTCDDLGPDPAYPRRRIGTCFRQGDTISLNQWLVLEGLALNFEPYAKRRFKADEASAQAKAVGIWRGCFANPQDFRRWNKSKAELLGTTCTAASEKAAKAKLFPDTATTCLSP